MKNVNIYTMEISVNSKRPICARCMRPQVACICQWIRPLAPLPEVLILQHPLEVMQAKGSARLLHLSLTGSQMHSDEVFEPSYLDSCLHVPGKTAVLLYPEWNAAQDNGMCQPEKPAPEWLDNPAQLRLIVLDGTWRKSRKMLYLNPLLQSLPRLALSAMPASHYRIRKAHRPDQLSTLEAVCYALMQLEKNQEKYMPLLNAFDGFVAQLMRHGAPE